MFILWAKIAQSVMWPDTAWTTRIQFPLAAVTFLFATYFLTGSGAIFCFLASLCRVFFSPKAKRLERAAHYSPPSSEDVKNAWSVISTPLKRLHGMALERSDMFTFTCPYHRSSKQYSYFARTSSNFSKMAHSYHMAWNTDLINMKFYLNILFFWA